jgi:predicted RND superfamily exporter protein
MLTAIVTVVGIATVVHIIVRFREARLSGLAPREALGRAGVLLAAPIFWACSTDAVGFASLLVSDVGPVRDFGVMMAIGSLTVLVSVALLVPGLVLLGRFDSDPKRAWGEGLLDLQLAWLVRWIQRRSKTIGAAALLVAGVASAGIYRLEVESDFTRNFRRDSPIVRSYQFVEEHLGGAGVWDVLLPAPERLNWKYLKRVKKLEQRLLDEANVLDGSHPGISKTLSLAGAVIDGGPVRLEAVRPTFIRNAMVQAGLAGMEAKMPAFYHALHGEDPRQQGRYYMRIMLRCPERQPAHLKRMLIERVERICREEFAADDTTQGAEVTGFFVLLNSLIDSMLRDQWLAFAVATLGIGLMMVVALRSPIYAVVALVPNVVPIFVVLGLLGWLGLKMNMGAAMIAAVSMGLSVDSSIHYITAFRRALGENKSLHESLDAVHQTVGRAMVFSTLALIVGFSVLCTSQFVPTIYFGALVGMSMLGGLIGNLVVLPLLLKLVTREPV